jgi:ubiquitin-conjugating enzyme E2 D/E
MYLSPAQHRILIELQEMSSNPPWGCSVSAVGDNPFHYSATIEGPRGTPYEGATFGLEVKYPRDYPFHPPHIAFTTPIYHPNISPEGRIALDILQDRWSPQLTIETLLVSIQSLLCDPNPVACLMSAIGREYNINRGAYDRAAREWVLNYATVTKQLQ